MVLVYLRRFIDWFFGMNRFQKYYFTLRFLPPVFAPSLVIISWTTLTFNGVLSSNPVYSPHQHLTEMKRKIIFLLGFLLLFTSGYSQRELIGLKLYPQMEKFDLSNSVELSVDDFFQRRMRNREKEKVMGKRCEILSADTNFIYFGYPYPYTGKGVGKKSRHHF